MPEQSEPMPALAPAVPRRWLRFSLASLLWAVTVVSLLVTTVVMGIRLRQAERENQKFRDEFGVLAIQDSRKINVLGVRTHESLEYCWRIYLPPGYKYWIWTADSGIPASGLPKEKSGSELSGGTWLVFAGINRKPDGPATSYVECHLDSEHGGTSGQRHVLAPDWTKGTSGTSSDGVGAGESAVLDPDQPATLVRLQVVPQSGSVLTAPCDGFMIWIEAEPIPDPPFVRPGGPPGL